MMHIVYTGHYVSKLQTLFISLELSVDAVVPFNKYEPSLRLILSLPLKLHAPGSCEFLAQPLFLGPQNIFLQPKLAHKSFQLLSISLSSYIGKRIRIAHAARNPREGLPSAS